MSREELETRLASVVNELINHQFSRLVGILYRIDVSEKKLKSLLKEYPDTASGLIIAKLIIERQEQKMESRRQHGNPPSTGDEEKW